MLKERRMKSITALCMTVLMCICMLTSVFAKDTVYVERTADVVFIVDATGSMGTAIKGVKKALGDFINLIAVEDVDVRVKFVVYKDITNDEPTVCSGWYGVKDGAGSYVQAIELGDGDDLPETIIDGYGMMLEDDFGFRSSAAKYCIALTDASYKMANNYGYTNEKGVIDKLNSKGISNSIICSSSDKSKYSQFLTNGGVLGDIYGDYAVFLEDIAKEVIENIYSADDYIMSPRSGKEGDGTVVTISANPKKSGVTLPKAPEVTFGGVKIEKVDYAGGKATFIVPEDKLPGKYEVKMFLDGDSWSLGNFTVISGAEYGELSPKSATEGNSTLVTVPVKKMNYSSSFAVYLNGKKVTVNSKQSDCFTFTVPTTMKFGEYVVTVSNGDVPVEIGNFTVEPKKPVFSEISVKTGKEGTAVVERVNVSNISTYTSDFAVYINGEKAEVTYKSSLYFKFNVPKTLKPGDYSCRAVFNGVIYDLGTYTVTGTPPIHISFGTLSVLSGKEGVATVERITVSPSPDYAKLSVTVGGNDCPLTYKGSSYFKFAIPKELIVGEYDAIVSYDGEEAKLGTYTVLEEPVPDVKFGPLSVLSGEAGKSPVEKITVSKKPAYDKLSVTIDGLECAITYTGSTYFKFAIPAELTAGTYDVIVTHGKENFVLGKYTANPGPDESVAFSKLPITEGNIGVSVSEKITFTKMNKYPTDFAVTMGDVPCEISYKGSSYFRFNTPKVIPEGTYDIIVTCNGKDYNIGNYKVNGEPAPTVKYSALPIVSGEEGATTSERISISETIDYDAGFSVTVGGLDCEISYKCNNYFRFLIPSTLTPGKYNAVVHYKGFDTTIGTYEVSATVVPEPVFGKLLVLSGKPGDKTLEKIIVSNVKTYPDDFTILIDETLVDVKYKCTSYFTFETPTDLENGTHEVKVIFAGKEYSLGDYTVKVPEVPMFKVISITVSGTIIRVTASDVKYEDIKVYVGGVEVPITYPGSSYFKVDAKGCSGQLTVDYYGNKNVDLGYTYK